MSDVNEFGVEVENENENEEVRKEKVEKVKEKNEVEEEEEVEKEKRERERKEVEKEKRERERKEVEEEIEISADELLDEDYIRILFNKVDRNSSYTKLMAFCNYLVDVARSVDVNDLRTGAQFRNVKDFVQEVVNECLDAVRKRDKILEEKKDAVEWGELLKMEAISAHKGLSQEERLRKLRKEFKEINQSIRKVWGDKVYDEVSSALVFHNNGVLDSRCVTNYDLIVQNDPHIQEKFKFNTFDNSVYVDGRLFKNSDLLDLISYFDRVYRIHDDIRIMNAISKIGNLPSYHPIKDIIEEEPWDGKNRIDVFFNRICKVEEDSGKMDDYHKEVARMLFYGGIARLYNPGCKFDYMIILKGRQGTCKTTLAHLLALDESAYSEVTTMDGQEAIECISNAWICEVAELLALTRAREVQAIKAFTTRQFDKYRPPYARVTETIPRSCIFIGTTNDSMFLSDSTGNRRYLPVEVRINASEFFKNLDSEVKPYILQCWREALYKYGKGETYLAIPHDVYDIVEEVRERYVDDDPIEGVILEYLENMKVGDKVSGLELYLKCYNGIRSKYTSSEGRKIASIVNKFPFMKYSGARMYFKDYGRQRYWEKMR